ncbi:DUF6124 family protein [Pseudomonas akapageensis]|uniref:DUF6124 family protein n=1 Tax=Pseudomonas akapageensis TaxID=2609961 RepID=UPI00140CCEC1|nr:DUF3077 domain-containing protein [Pseudomonas akapageensis]
MFKPTPNPPQLPQDTKPVTRSHAFGQFLGSQALFTVREGIDIEDALIHASDRMHCAAAIACEVIERAHPEFQALARSVVHQIEVATALVEASIAGLET